MTNQIAPISDAVIHSKEFRESLKKRLPFKYVEKVQLKLSGTKKSAIYAAMHGARPNIEILQAIVEVAEEHEAKQKELAERLKNI